MEESQRQKKIASVLQRDLVDILQGAATKGGLKGVIISVSKVKVTADLTDAKVYLSIFPNDKGKELLEGIRSNKPITSYASTYVLHRRLFRIHRPNRKIFKRRGQSYSKPRFTKQKKKILIEFFALHSQTLLTL